MSKKAVLASGETLEYLVPDALSAPQGPFPSKDGMHILLFRAPDDPHWRRRLEAMEERFAAKSLPDAEAAFFGAHILWPRALVEPSAGVLWPVVPENFLFGETSAPYPALSAARKGRERKSIWFLSEASRNSLSEAEKGDGVKLLDAMIALARTMDFLHKTGFAFPGFSGESVLLDLIHGDALLLAGEEGLVLEGLPAPRVPETPEYAAPELFHVAGVSKIPADTLKTSIPVGTLKTSVSAAKTPAAPAIQPVGNVDRAFLRVMQEANRHALSVLFYQLLLWRYPLEQPDASGQGAEAWRFLEGPDFHTSHPGERTIQDLGEDLEFLFLRAFTDGLRCPRERPTALHWRRVLEKIRQKLSTRGGGTGGNLFTTQGGLSSGNGGKNAAASPPILLQKEPRLHSPRTVWVECGWTERQGVSADGTTPDFDMDISAFLLEGKSGVRNEENMVYYGSPRHKSHSVELLDQLPDGTDPAVKKRMIVDVDRVPPEISRIDLVATVYYTRSERCFADAQDAFLRLRNAGGVLLEVHLSQDFSKKSVCRAASLRRKDSEWRLSRHPEGENGGLAGVCDAYGIHATGG